MRCAAQQCEVPSSQHPGAAGNRREFALVLRGTCVASRGPAHCTLHSPRSSRSMPPAPAGARSPEAAVQSQRCRARQVACRYPLPAANTLQPFAHCRDRRRRGHRCNCCPGRGLPDGCSARGQCCWHFQGLGLCGGVLTSASSLQAQQQAAESGASALAALEAAALAASTATTSTGSYVHVHDTKSFIEEPCREDALSLMALICAA